jgi:D-tyrosyl-tRNA(Tyr) deacylase
MRAVIQRVRRAQVTVDSRVVGQIGSGLLVLLGIGKGDTAETAGYLAEKTANLRIFDDASGKMNVSLLESGGAALVVSQFTLYGDVRRGRRPAFDRAAPPQEAKEIYEQYAASLRSFRIQVETGIFQAHMVVESENDGPVTILLDSEKLF